MISPEELAARSRGGNIQHALPGADLQREMLQGLNWAIDHLSGEIHAVQKTQLAAAEIWKDGIAQLLKAFQETDSKQTERLQRLEGMLGGNRLEVGRRKSELNVERESPAAQSLESAVQALQITHAEHLERLENLQLDLQHEIQATAMKWTTSREATEQVEQAVNNTTDSLQTSTTLYEKSCFGNVLIDTASAIKQQACDSPTSKTRGKQTLLKDPMVNPVRHEQLLSWSENVAEEFDYNQFLVELIGQTIWHVLGVLGIPLLLPLYSCSMHALRNRAMWMHCSCGQGGQGFPFSVFGSQVLFSALTLASLIIIIGFQPEHTTLTDAVVVLMLVVLKCLTIAIKYGYMPRAVWNQMNVVTWDTSRLSGLLLVGAWLNVSQETAEMQVDWALLSTVGLAEDEPYLTFLQPTTADSARAIQALQGKTTRRLVAEVLSQEHVSCLPHGLTLQHDMHPPLEEAGWPATIVAGQATMPLRAFFEHLIQVILQAEKKSHIGVMGMKVLTVASVVVTFTPCIGRLLEGRPFMGNSILAILSIGMYLLPLFMTCVANFLYLHVAIRDMWRRRALMQCCTALLSMMPEDRKHVPWQVKTLGVIDTRNVKTMEAFLHLRDLCKDWGIFYSLRCTSFVNAYTLVTACLVAGLLVFIQFQLYEFITKSILLAALVNPFFLLSCIVQLAVYGEGVNSTAARLSMLLQRHASAITESVLGLHLNNADESPEDCRLRQALKGVKSAQTNIALDQDFVKLLGQRCGISILTALYAVPVYVALRLKDLCTEQPELCTLF